MAARGGPSRPDATPAADTPVPEVVLSVAAVARRLGVAPATLRTWDRRYGLGPSAHAPGTHRRYRAGDLARLEIMRGLTRDGVNPADAAAVALAAPLPDAPPQPPAVAATPRRPAGRGGGGPVVALGAAAPETRGLARAAMALDAANASALLRASIRSRGVVATWETVVVPVLVGIGRRWEATGRGVDVEHLLSECVIGAMRGVVTRRAPQAPARPLLLVSAEEEMHSLPLFAVEAALAERDVAARVLGARVPRDALAAAVTRTGAAGVLVWSQSPATGHVDQLALPPARPATAVVVGGPGWPDDLPAGIGRAHDLAGAADALAALV